MVNINITAVLPPAKLGRHNDPHWNLLANVDVCRMDHSIGMTQHVGTLKDDKGKVVANIAYPIGSFAFIVDLVKKPKGYQGAGRIAVDCSELLKMVYGLAPGIGAEPEVAFMKGVMTGTRFTPQNSAAVKRAITSKRRRAHAAQS